MTSHVPAMRWAKEIAALAPGRSEPCVYLPDQGPERTDTTLSHAVRPYWDILRERPGGIPPFQP